MQKLFTKENFMKVLNFTLCVACCVALLQAVMSVAPIQLFCDDLFKVGTDTISTLQTNLVKLCTALCPLSLIVVVLGLMLTHDEKKIAFLIKIGGTIFVATALMLVINSGAVVSTLESWFPKGKAK